MRQNIFKGGQRRCPIHSTLTQLSTVPTYAVYLASHPPYCPPSHSLPYPSIILLLTASPTHLLIFHSLSPLHPYYPPSHCLPYPPIILPPTASTTHQLMSKLLYPLAFPRGSDGPKATLQYERDLGPGEYFGEAVLSGVRTRSITAIAMTSCDLVSFEDDDFLAAQVREREGRRILCCVLTGHGPE
jgi:hypothetical protein